MTNKKFKLAAMSLALTACVAASPLAANADTADAAAEGTAPAVGTPAPAAETPAPTAENPAPAAETPAPAAENPAPAAETPAPAAETPAPAAETPAPAAENPAPAAENPAPAAEAPAPAAETPAPAAENPAPAAAPVLMVMAPAPAAPAASTSAAQIGETSYDTLEDAIAAANAQKQLASVRPLNLPARLWLYILAKLGLSQQKRWGELGRKDTNRLVETLTNDIYEINGKGRFRDEFVTCGGVSLASVDMNTLESRVCPHLFFAGEVLDVDAITGGFNLQAAWSMGHVVGRNIAE